MVRKNFSYSKFLGNRRNLGFRLLSDRIGATIYPEKANQLNSNFDKTYNLSKKSYQNLNLINTIYSPISHLNFY